MPRQSICHTQLTQPRKRKGKRERGGETLKIQNLRERLGFVFWPRTRGDSHIYREIVTGIAGSACI